MRYFARVLAQAGLSRGLIVNKLEPISLQSTFVKKAAEKRLTDENYKAAYESYTPEVTAQIIKVDSEDKAKEVLAAAKLS